MPWITTEHRIGFQEIREALLADDKMDSDRLTAFITDLASEADRRHPGYLSQLMSTLHTLQHTRTR